MAYRNKRGWYKLDNPSKFLPPQDNHMKSFNENAQSVEYKSSLEFRAMRYCDNNSNVVKWSVEPFNIKYFKSLTGKTHRYYPDIFLEFYSGDKFLVEVKSYKETIPPKKTKKQTHNSKLNYQRALQTYTTNKEKWKAAREFCKVNNIKFIFLTEKELK